MESHKSVTQKRLESSLHNSPTSSSPLRKSIIVQKISTDTLGENDDEAERIARRREISSSTPLTTNLTNNRRHSLGLRFLANIPAPQMAESISQCIKLSAENKINIKNAFSLEMIDFMTYMIKKQDANMSNLQMASTSLDVSTKIYGFRVDSVHTDILKIVGGLDKQTADNHTSESKEDDLDDHGEGNVEVQKKKKKKVKQKICTTVEALKGNVEILKPMSMMIGEGDLQTSDMLYQAMLPNHASSGFYQHPYNDVIVDVIEDEPDLESNSTKYFISAIKDFSDLNICESYSKFEFLGWSVEDEPEETPAQEDECDDNEDNDQFQFDLDASVEQEENPLPEPMNYFDIGNDDYEVNVHAFQKDSNRDEDIVDEVETEVTAPMSEYSFVQPNMNLHWAGPSHWKFRKFARSSAAVAAVSGSKIMGACMQAPVRKRREILLAYEEIPETIKAKFTLSQSNKVQAKTAKMEWNAENLTLPEDVHYDIVQVSRYLYLHPKRAVRSASREAKKNTDAVAIADVSDGERYDYNNPNDTLEYCPDVNNDGADRDDCNDDCNFESGNTASPNMLTQGFTGDNMVAAPKLANKISIAYCLKAKKIDMRQLKKSIWTCLKSRDNVDVTNIREAVKEAEVSTMQESKAFSNVYKMLPELLSKTNAEALSVPISFISLLHLANEKELKIHSLPDMSDVIVEAN